MMKRSFFVAALALLAGCESVNLFDSSFGFDSEPLVGGGAVAGKDYVTGLKPSAAARQYFARVGAVAPNRPSVTVTPGDDKGTGVMWTDDGGIVIPPGHAISFTNHGYCMDPHLPAPRPGDEMQFVKTSSLIPEELRGTYRNLLARASAGDEEVRGDMQRLVWALRTAGSRDAMATCLTDRQREILNECAEGGSFDEYVSWQATKEKILAEIRGRVGSALSVKVGNVTYSALDLLEPETAKAKVAAHVQSLVNMSRNMPVVKSGFNYGEVAKGIYTDIKGCKADGLGGGWLAFRAKVANSTSKPFTFYPMDYAAQVGSGAAAGFYATSSGMFQRTTTENPTEVEVEEDKVLCDHIWRVIANKTSKNIGEMSQSWQDVRKELRDLHKHEIDDMRDEIAREILNRPGREDGLEYGTLIYVDIDNTVKRLDISEGHRDWQIIFDGKTIQRTTMRDGRYYVYENGNQIGREVASKWGDHYMHWSYRWLSGKTCVETGSWAIPTAPRGSIPLEIVHLHPGYNSFSPEDLMEAEKRGLAISVINQGGIFRDDRIVVYDPSEGSFKSSLGEGDVRRLESYHEKVRKIRNDDYKYICIRCGATK